MQFHCSWRQAGDWASFQLVKVFQLTVSPQGDWFNPATVEPIRIQLKLLLHPCMLHPHYCSRQVWKCSRRLQGCSSRGWIAVIQPSHFEFEGLRLQFANLRCSRWAWCSRWPSECSMGGGKKPPIWLIQWSNQLNWGWNPASGSVPGGYKAFQVVTRLFQSEMKDLHNRSRRQILESRCQTRNSKCSRRPDGKRSRWYHRITSIQDSGSLQLSTQLIIQKIRYLKEKPSQLKRSRRPHRKRSRWCHRITATVHTINRAVKFIC